MAKFFVVATPIGNLKDITLRALEVLRSVDYILAEDTRKARILLNHYKIEKPIISYFQHSSQDRIKRIIKLLKEDKNLAFITEAGTPGVSDPGNKLIEIICEHFGQKAEIIPVPGPSAVTTIASIAGFSTDRFLFLGFVPKRKQQKFFQEIITSKYPVIFFESPHRILKTLEKLNELNPDLKMVVGRELTKKFETIYRGTPKEIINQLNKEKTKELSKDKIKGEFTIITHPH